MTATKTERHYATGLTRQNIERALTEAGKNRWHAGIWVRAWTPTLGGGIGS
jgi:hypothetical protein